MKRSHLVAFTAALALTALTSGTAFADEIGHYAPGVINIRDLAMPEPGLYGAVYNFYYTTDRLNDGLSAIYTFFAPEQEHRSLGTFAVMHQIEEVKRLGLSYVYLGYWIAECRKMSYKTKFKPTQGLVNGTWQRVDTIG